MKHGRLLLVCAVLALLLLVPCVMAETGSPSSGGSDSGEGVPPPSNSLGGGGGWFDVGGIIDAIKGLPGTIAQAILDKVAEAFTAPGDWVIGKIGDYLTKEVDTSMMFGVWERIVAAILLLFGSMLSWFGLRLIAVGLMPPEERERTKQFAKNFVILLVMLSLSYYIYNLLLAIAAALSSFIFPHFSATTISSTLTDPLGGASPMLQIGLSPFYLTGALFAAITILLRNVIVILGVALFPIILALRYNTFVSSFRGMADAIFTLLLVQMFLPVLDSLILSISIKAGATDALMLIASLFLVGLANLAVFIFSFFAIKDGGLHAKPEPSVGSVQEVHHYHHKDRSRDDEDGGEE